MLHLVVTIRAILCHVSWAGLAWFYSGWKGKGTFLYIAVSSPWDNSSAVHMYNLWQTCSSKDASHRGPAQHITIKVHVKRYS